MVNVLDWGETVWIRALAGDIVLYFSANHFTLTVAGEFNAGG